MSSRIVCYSWIGLVTLLLTACPDSSDDDDSSTSPPSPSPPVESPMPSPVTPSAIPPSPTPATPDTPSPTPSATLEPEPTPTSVPVITPTPGFVPTPSPTITPTPSPTPIVTPTSAPEPSPTPTPSPTPHATPTPTPTPLVTPTSTPEPSPTPTPSPTPEPPTPTPAIDADGDGYFAAEDCDDGNEEIHPGAAEVCDTLDNDCSGVVDDGLTFVDYYLDVDGDGFGTGDAVSSCATLDGYAEENGDCADDDGAVNPAAAETCNGLDDDCDVLIDDDDSDVVDQSTWYIDYDEDGYGVDRYVKIACVQPDGYVEDASDCNDFVALINPDASEVCDDVDNDCDGLVDDADDNVAATNWQPDEDGDGFGAPGEGIVACNQPVGYVSNALDCDDSDENTTDGTLWYLDDDGDAYGQAENSTKACSQPEGYVGNDGDCDDTDEYVNPDQAEVCNEKDDDCDSEVDEEASDMTTYYVDADSDGYGDDQTGMGSCTPIEGYVSVGGDCNEADAAVNPGATEECDWVDNDCDSEIDEGCEMDGCADVLLHCDPNSSILETVCGRGPHAITGSNSSNASYVRLGVGVHGAYLTNTSGTVVTITVDTNLCDVSGFNDRLAQVELF